MPVVCAVLVLGACESLPDWTFDAQQIPPLQYAGEIHTPEEALAEKPLPDVLALTPEMREFVRRHTLANHNPRNDLAALHSAIKSPGDLGLQYDPFADGDAATTFARGTANCLSYAHLFIALAREAGLNARYQWIEIRPEWHRIGERVAVRMHVNVQVKVRSGTEYMIDIDPLSRSEVAGSRLISDADGLALHHNNLAMAALAEEDNVLAWKHLVRGIKVAPALPQLWVNLGAIYRQAGQYRAAEQSYSHALEIDANDRSAMNNLVVLYEIEGREEERDYWHDRMRRYRLNNPYYHANLGDIALEEGDYEAAYDHYLRAKNLQPLDGQLLYSLGLTAYKLGRAEEAHELITEAINQASFTVEKELYRVELRSIEEQISAQL